MNEIDFFRGRRTFSDGARCVSSLFSVPIFGVDDEAVNLFLSLGYVPGEKTLFKGIKCLQAGRPSDLWGNNLEASVNSSPSEIKRILLESIEKNLDLSKDQVVPLSGGMDSRIVLGLLLEFVDAKKIQTYTFGVRDSYDYEIPNKIARSLGTKHTNFSSKDTHYSIEGLIRAAIASDGNTEVFHPLVLNRVSDYYGSNAVFWSGFAGDLVGGGFEYGSSNDPFIQNYEFDRRRAHYHINDVGIETFKSVAGEGKKFGEGVADAEAIFWENHVERYTAHHIFRNDMTVMAPLVSYPFLRHFLKLDPELRQGKQYFNTVFSSLFPYLFSFPTKDYGFRYSANRFRQPIHISVFYLKSLLWRLFPSTFSHPNAAYIDMKNAINNRQDVVQCIDLLLADISSREILDSGRVANLLNEHRSGIADHTKDLINIASLEVILKAGKL
jgi:hypothetical protein